MAEITIGPPAVAQGIGRLTFAWPNTGLEIVAQRLRDEGRAELWFYHSNGDGKRDLLEICEINLLASASMNSLAKRMAEGTPNFPWRTALTYLKQTTLIHLREGDPGMTIHGAIETARHPGYYLGPVIMRGVPNVIFGDKGVNKTTLALLMLGLVRLGDSDSNFGFDVGRGETSVAVLDWENTQPLTEYTLSRLARGGGPVFDVAYLHCKIPLADDAERIAKFISEKNAKVALVDSLGWAAGSGDRFDSSGKNAAIRCLEAIRGLNITTLIIAQNAKSEGGKKTIYGSTFFTYGARNIFELRRAHDDTGNEQSIALFHVESNYSRRYDPMGFKLTFTPDTIAIEREDVSMAEFSERITQTLQLYNYLADGAKNLTQIAVKLGVKTNRASVLLNKLQGKGKVMSLGAGMWGLARGEEIE